MRYFEISGTTPVLIDSIYIYIVIHEIGLLGNVVVSFFPLIIYIYIYIYTYIKGFLRLSEAILINLFGICIEVLLSFNLEKRLQTCASVTSDNTKLEEGEDFMYLRGLSSLFLIELASIGPTLTLHVP